LLRSEWNRVCRKAGFPVGRQHGGYSFHDTRHSCISNLHAAGVPDSVAMSISNHKTPAVFLRYGVRHESAQRAALEQVETLLRGLGTVPTVRPVAGER
jgi:integrase